ncbi:MAG: carboxypeptidase regulatory-like domain-containing protein, partial [Vicinamibacterales bacterium]
MARDTTQAVLPGVTVEAASPALIEKVRVAVTDGQGRFNITNLPPGTYSVTFTLPGFATFKREGVEISAGFTATANSDMKVGGLEETVTVTGASPVVDIQNVRTQDVNRMDVVEALPTGARDLTAFAGLTLGVVNSTQGRNDVGGSMAETNTSLSIHGSRGDDSKMNYAGMNTNSLHGKGGGQMRIWKFNTIGVQETTVDTGGAGATTETGGANLNMIPREGGNLFSMHSVLAYSNNDFASGKVPQELIDRGSAEDQSSLKQVSDYGVGFGGAFVRDKLWYYGSVRFWGGHTYGTNTFFNGSPDWWRFEPDLNRRAFTDNWARDVGGRFTFQLNDKNKFSGGIIGQRACACPLAIGLGSQASPEADVYYHYSNPSGHGMPMFLYQADWNYAASNKLLVQAGGSFLIQAVTQGNDLEQRVSILERTTSKRWGALSGGHDDDGPRATNNYNQRLSVSYITGSHQIQAGMELQQGNFENLAGGVRRSFLNGTRMPQWDAVNYNFVGGRPESVTQFSSPISATAIVRRQALFAQDQWTIDRLTLNYGIRFDHFHGWAAALDLPAGPFAPARSFPELKNIPNFKDISPRIGVAYDLFGNGKTAIKGSFGRYLESLGGEDTVNLAPSNALVTSTSRGWNDANRDYVPDCDLTNFAANGECAAIDNPLFGTARPQTTWAANQGWGVREANYQIGVVLQHELIEGVGLQVGYHRTWWTNQNALVDRSRTPADYQAGCITAPTDPDLGDVSGQRVCGIYDVNLDALRRPSQIERVLAKDVNTSGIEPTDIFNGLDLGLNARFSNGAMITGGLTLGRQDFNFCWLNDLPHVSETGFNAAPGALPRTDEFCRVTGTLWDGTGSQV